MEEAPPWIAEILSAPRVRTQETVTDEAIARWYRDHLARFETDSSFMRLRDQAWAWEGGGQRTINALARPWLGGTSQARPPPPLLRAVLESERLQEQRPELAASWLYRWSRRANPGGLDHQRLVEQTLYEVGTGSERTWNMASFTEEAAMERSLSAQDEIDVVYRVQPGARGLYLRPFTQGDIHSREGEWVAGGRFRVLQAQEWAGKVWVDVVQEAALGDVIHELRPPERGGPHPGREL
jgi:hypothetical protein